MRSMLNRLFGQHSPAGSSGPSVGQFGLILLVLAFGPPFCYCPVTVSGPSTHFPALSEGEGAIRTQKWIVFYF